MPSYSRGDRNSRKKGLGKKMVLLVCRDVLSFATTLVYRVYLNLRYTPAYG